MEQVIAGVLIRFSEGGLPVSSQPDETYLVGEPAYQEADTELAVGDFWKPANGSRRYEVLQVYGPTDIKGQCLHAILVKRF